MTKIGIIGYGFVGKAVEYGFTGEDNEIVFHDKHLPSRDLDEVAQFAEFIFVCVPTPFKDDHIDLSIMNETIEALTSYTDHTDKIIVIKSTVIPGTTRSYAKRHPFSNFCMNPEFLTEANYLEDFISADRIVVGSDDEQSGLRLVDLYHRHLPHVPIFHTDLSSAEMVKYMANCFLATKVIFANEIHALCERLEINYDEVKKIVGSDKRIGGSHFEVTSLRGFGKKCLPKDIISLIGLYHDLGVDASLLEAVWKKNGVLRKVRDWESIPFVKSE